MPKLIIYRDSKAHQEVHFSEMLSIGRDKRNDVILNAPEVSAFHASIIRDADGNDVLCDQASRNFTKVGGERIHYFTLSHGTTFQIAKFFLTYFSEAVDEDAQSKVRVSRKIAVEEHYRQDTQTVFAKAGKILISADENRDPQTRLSILLSLINSVNSTLDYCELMEKALEVSMDVMAAERGFLALKNRSGNLVYSSVKGFNLDCGRLRISSTMIRKVTEEGQSILTANAIRENDYGKAESVISYGLKSVLCVPLRTDSGILGCIYLDNRKKAGSFSAMDLEFLTILAHQIAIAIENAKLHKKVLDEQASLKSRLRLNSSIIAKSDKMVSLYNDVHKVAPTRVPVLILGETGTGKELVARAIHDLSGRPGRFIAVNCAAIPDNLLESELFGYEKGAFTDARSPKPGLFELSQDGTIFLDEIGEMGPSLQPKLLRVLQDKKVNRLGSVQSRSVDVRILSATNRHLKTMMRDESFRQDLYYRIAGVELKVPPIRDRKEDIPPLANFFLLKFAEENDLMASRISHKAMKILMAYDWPGNANELKNVIGRAALFGNGRIVHPEDLPEEIQAFDDDSFESFPTLADIERKHIRKAFQRTKGNKRRAAQMLGIARDTLYKKIDKYSIDEVSD